MIQMVVVAAILFGLYQAVKAKSLQSSVQNVHKPFVQPGGRYGAATLTMVGAPVQTSAPITEAAYYAQAQAHPSYVPATNEPETTLQGTEGLLPGEIPQFIKDAVAAGAPQQWSATIVSPNLIVWKNKLNGTSFQSDASGNIL